jgi:cytochrome oxidase Cu insertion factor (SCO1/SenC/PrrC family)
MGDVLAKNFDGEHRWITDPENNPAAKIDAMFFTATEEVPNDDDPSLAYKDRHTFILCNPNAMFYQHMINYPHAFYLRYF